MFCPECGLDYEEGSLLCADCGVELIEDPMGDETPEDVEFVPLGEVTDVAAFSVVTSYLEQENIPWFVENDHGVMVYVAQNRVVEARRSLEIASPVATRGN
jgi:hypothetical protein